MYRKIQFYLSAINKQLSCIAFQFPIHLLTGEIKNCSYDNITCEQAPQKQSIQTISEITFCWCCFRHVTSPFCRDANSLTRTSRFYLSAWLNGSRIRCLIFCFILSCLRNEIICFLQWHCSENTWPYRIYIVPFCILKRMGLTSENLIIIKLSFKVLY